jgi:hypothetical protein
MAPHPRRPRLSRSILSPLETHKTRRLPNHKVFGKINANGLDPDNACWRPGVAERSKYQQKIIKNYYDNREAISLQRLSELVTELYLAEGKARQRQWKAIVSALEKLKIPAARIEHLVKQDNPSLVAKLVEELLAKK